MRHTLLITALTLGLITSSAVTAEATFPGLNGPIAFHQFDPATERIPLLRAMPDGTQITELSDRPGFFSDWRADGRRIAFDFFQPHGDEQIATMNADGSGLRVVTSGRGIHEVPSWSPNGRRIVFDFSRDDPSAADFQTRLWTMRANGSHAIRVPMRRPGFDVEPRYAPNGPWIAFMRLRSKGESQQQAVFIVPADGGRSRMLTPWRLNAEHPTWSPDGRLIIFNTPEGTIKAMRPNGRRRHTILPASEGFGGHKPSFSPDGSRIIFMCENQGLLDRHPDDYNEDICVMEANGSNILKLISTPDTLENWPSWGPAGDG
jgi:TolB protein